MPSGAEKWCEPFDIQLGIEVGKSLGNDKPVFQRITASGGRLRAVSKSPPGAVWSASDIDSVEAQPPPTRRFHATDCRNIVGRARYRSGGNGILGNQLAVAVDVGKNALEQFSALRHAFSDLAPLKLRY